MTSASIIRSKFSRSEFSRKSTAPNIKNGIMNNLSPANLRYSVDKDELYHPNWREVAVFESVKSRF